MNRRPHFTDIKRFAREMRREFGESFTVKDYLVLSRIHDPFYREGAAVNRKRAEWLRDILEEYGISTTHLRDIHYSISDEPDARKHDGTPYLNDKVSWVYLTEAAKDARYAGYIDPRDMIERRTQLPLITQEYDPWREEPEAYLDPLLWEFPDILRFDLDTPDIEVSGYDYTPGDDQRYLLEIWIEKQGFEENIEPVCESLGVNLVTGIGYQSITRIVEFLGRVEKADGRPARIFYVSDYDKAGRNMPVQVSRQLEFWMERYDIDADVKLSPVILTPEQIEEHDLPPAPDSNAVELSALRKRAPGEIERILTEAIAPYRDINMRLKYREREQEAEEMLRKLWEENEEEAEAIERETNEILAKYREQLTAELSELRKRFETVLHAVRTPIDPPERPIPEESEVPDESDWLFDSQREWLDQLDMYKKRKRR